MAPKILLISGYDAASHQYWRHSLSSTLSQYDWTQLALSPSHFAWRTRGSSAILAFNHQQELDDDYDLVIVTSMVDLASLRGFLPKLAAIPTIVYFHENQFVYPISSDQPNILNAQLTTIYTALCADVVVFNSEYNRSTFFNGARGLLKQMPEKLPSSILDQCHYHSLVIPVPIAQSYYQNYRQPCESVNDKIELVWNHRWEYDKQPGVFFDAIRKLKQSKIEFCIHVLGQSFRKSPTCFSQAENEFADEIQTWGFQPKAKYDQILKQADIVVSTAMHDFQGLSMLEAIAAGCSPVAPRRVAYPEYLPAQHLYNVESPITSESFTESHEATRLFEHLMNIIKGRQFEVPNVSQFSVELLSKQYDSLICRLV